MRQALAADAHIPGKISFWADDHIPSPRTGSG
jgi:hypothetical protein